MLGKIAVAAAFCAAATTATATTLTFNDFAPVDAPSVVIGDLTILQPTETFS